MFCSSWLNIHPSTHVDWYIKSFLSAVVQFLSCLGLFLKEGKKIAIGENLKRWCLLWERKQHQAVAHWTSSCEVPPSKLESVRDLFLSSLLRKFCLRTHTPIALDLAWVEKKQKPAPSPSRSISSLGGVCARGKNLSVREYKMEKLPGVRAKS